MSHHRSVQVMILASWIFSGASASPVYELGNMSNLTMDNIERNSQISGRAFPSVSDINPEVGTDFTQVTWAHAVDNRKKLRRALRGSAMMLEADVSLGKLKSDPHSEDRPIMAHPPISASDLSLEDFLDEVLDEAYYKGIKLDFKSVEVLERALQIVKTREHKIRVPLWLNADIIKGPVDSTSNPIDAQLFLSLTKYYFPTAVISAGWTTKLAKEGYYTHDQCRNMRDALIAAQVTAPVTFPVRAGLVANLESRQNILWLLREIPGSTVTIWSSYGDEVDVFGLLDFIDAIGKEFIYIDVHSGLRCRMSRYRAAYSMGEYLLGFGRNNGRTSSNPSFFALLTYLSCATSFLPWNINSHNQQ